MSAKKQKSGIIELMRFLFAVEIVLFHFKRKQHTGRILPFIHYDFFNRGYIGVEFFFLLSGLLMAASIYKRVRADSSPLAVTDHLGSETAAYVWKKYTRLFPQHMVAFVLIYLVLVVGRRLFLQPVAWASFTVRSIPGFFLIQKLGWNMNNINSVEWYISAMLIAMLVVYPLCRRFYDLFTCLIGPFGGLAILGWLYFQYGTFNGASTWTGHIFVCVLRAIAEISLGCGAYEAARRLGERSFTESQSKKLTLLEYLGFALGLLFGLSNIGRDYEYLALLVMMVSIILAFSGITQDAVFNNDVCYRLGSWSLPVYLAQLAGIYFVVYFCSGLPYGVRFLLTVLSCAVATFLVLKGGSWIQAQIDKRKTEVANA